MRVLHVDDHLIVIDKPAGLLSVPGRGPDKQDCVAARVAQQWPDALVVHRLDQATSGLLLMARGRAAQRALSSAFEHGGVDKRYIAVVHGQVVGEAGSVELPLGADWPNRPRQHVDVAGGKPALTHWRAMARDAASDTTRLVLTPATGRTHQLRVHLLAIGHPIVGDRLYGDPAREPASDRMLLHASELRFEHPGSGAAMDLAADVPF